MNMPTELWWKLDTDPGDLLRDRISHHAWLPLNALAVQHELTKPCQLDGQTTWLLAVKAFDDNRMFSELPQWAMDPNVSFTLVYNSNGTPQDTIVIAGEHQELTIPLATSQAADTFKQWAWRGPERRLVNFDTSYAHGRVVMIEERDVEDVVRNWYFVRQRPTANYQLPKKVQERGATPVEPVVL